MATCPLHRVSFNMNQQKQTNYIHILHASNNSMLQNNLISTRFPEKKKINCTFIVRCENSLKIWREDVRLYSWRENKHGWLSHWQQWLLGALAAVDKVTGYQSGLKAVLFLSLCAYIMLCWAHHGNIETGNRITCWFKRGQWPSDFWSGNL